LAGKPLSAWRVMCPAAGLVCPFPAVGGQNRLAPSCVSDSCKWEPRLGARLSFISASDRRNAPYRRHASQPHWPSGQLDLMPPSADTFSQGHVSKKRRHVALRRRLPRFFPGWWRRLNRSSVSRNGNRDGCLDRVEGGQTKQGAMTEATAQALDRCTEPCRRHASVRSGYTS